MLQIPGVRPLGYLISLYLIFTGYLKHVGTEHSLHRVLINLGKLFNLSFFQLISANLFKRIEENLKNEYLATYLLITLKNAYSLLSVCFSEFVTRCEDNIVYHTQVASRQASSGSLPCLEDSLNY